MNLEEAVVGLRQFLCPDYTDAANELDIWTGLLCIYGLAEKLGVKPVPFPFGENLDDEHHPFVQFVKEIAEIVEKQAPICSDFLVEQLLNDIIPYFPLEYLNPFAMWQDLYDAWSALEDLPKGLDLYPFLFALLVETPDGDVWDDASERMGWGVAWSEIAVRGNWQRFEAGMKRANLHDFITVAEVVCKDTGNYLYDGDPEAPDMDLEQLPVSVEGYETLMEMVRGAEPILAACDRAEKMWIENKRKIAKKIARIYARSLNDRTTG